MAESFTILSFDYGDARIGVARADSQVKLAEGVATILNQDASSIDDLINKHEPSTLVVGLPRGLEGQETDQTKLARIFSQSLSRFNVPVILQDEALTTEEAKNYRKNEKESLDEIAACIILEDYMRENL